MTIGGYRDQYSRVKRFLDRALAPHHDPVRKHDDFIAYFVLCWALHDHIKNDLSLPRAQRTAIADAGRANAAITTARHLATGLKHFVEKPAKLPGENDLVLTIHGNSSATGAAHPRVQIAGGERRPAHEVAQEAFDAWTALLENGGLPTD